MATPVIVLTKSDLCDDIDAKLTELESVALGVDVVVTSGLSDNGYAGVSKYLLKGRTIAFVGSSGVGKSTLINRLIGKETLFTKAVREGRRQRQTCYHSQAATYPTRWRSGS